MELTFPLKLTYDEILVQFPSVYEFLDRDDDEVSPNEQLADYSSAYTSSPKLKEYLDLIGYTADEDGLNVRNEAALHTAHALFVQVSFEYDDVDSRVVDVTRHGHTWKSTPTWALFELGGDDDVDYCGSQPSCLTSTLIEALLKA